MPGAHETLGKHDLVAAGLKAIDDVLGAAGARRGGRGGMGDRTATPAPATGVPVDSGSRRRGIRIAAGDDLRVQRTRPVVEATARVARDRIRLGEWVIPKHHAVIASITMAHQSEQNFPDAKTFNPDRFLGGNPDTHTWIPFGGGVRRCLGAAFAEYEMRVVLSELFTSCTPRPTSERSEPSRRRAITQVPGRGATVVLG